MPWKRTARAGAGPRKLIGNPLRVQSRGEGVVVARGGGEGYIPGGIRTPRK